MKVHVKPHHAADNLVKYRVDQMATQPWPPGANDEREFASDADRNWSKFPMADCDHRLSVGTEVAGWALDLCVRCGAVTSEAQCLHPATQWNEQGTMLRCATCGIDGT